MATVNVIFGKMVPNGVLMGAQPSGIEDVTSSGTSAKTTMTAKTGDAAQVTASGGAVRVAFGPDPDNDRTVAATDTILILDGQTREFGGLQNGDKCYVIDN